MLQADIIQNVVQKATLTEPELCYIHLDNDVCH